MKYTINKWWLGLFPFLLLWMGCSDDKIDDMETPSKYVQIGSLVEKIPTRGSVIDLPDGMYYMGYQTTNNNTPVSSLYLLRVEESEIKEGAAKNSEDFYETDLLWANIIKKQGKLVDLTLSNVGENNDGTYAFPADNDIIWAETTVQTMSKVNFTLNHRMAQAKLKLKIDHPGITEIKAVHLEAIQRKYSFDRATGKVTRDDTAPLQDSPLTGGYVSNSGGKEWEGLGIFPAQKRTEEMKLVVETNLGKYSRSLPLAMIINGSENKEFEFLQGYCLELTASIRKGLTYTIHFSRALLTEWENKGSYITFAGPAGIYNANHLADWVNKYNAYNDAGRPADTDDKTYKALTKYGKYNESEQKWNFSLYGQINVTNPGEHPKIEEFMDNLNKKHNSFHITGISEQELIIVNNGTIDNDIFK